MEPGKAPTPCPTRWEAPADCEASQLLGPPHWLTGGPPTDSTLDRGQRSECKAEEPSGGGKAGPVGGVPKSFLCLGGMACRVAQTRGLPREPEPTGATKAGEEPLTRRRKRTETA